MSFLSGKCTFPLWFLCRMRDMDIIMGIRRLVSAIYRKLWLIILLGIIGGGASFYLGSNNSALVYEASTTIFTVVKNTNTQQLLKDNCGISYDNIILGRQFEQDFYDIMLSDRVLSKSVDKIKDKNINASNLKSMISLRAKKDSNIIRIIANSGSPEKAVSITKAVSESLVDRINEITNTNIIGIMEEAKKPLQPIETNNIKGILIGILGGVIIALVFIYIMELFDSTIRSVNDIEYNLDLQVLAQVPIYRGSK